MLELTAGEVVTYFDSPLGFRHGPKSALDADTLVVVYVSTDPYTRRYDLDIIAEIRAQLGQDAVTVISAEPIPDDPRARDRAARPRRPGRRAGRPALSGVRPVPRAVHRRWNTARPRTIPFPSGEVNRVVQGVTIHPMTTSGR